MKRKSFKYYLKSGWILLWIVLFVIVFTGYKSQTAENRAKEVKALQAQVIIKTAHAQTLEGQNEALKAKLEASSKIETSETQKEISRFYIRKYFGNEAAIAEKVFTCESNLNPMALNVKNKDGSTDRGIPQINSSNRTSFEKVTGLNYDVYAHDTETSIKYAKWLRDNSKGGWSNWVCFGLI